MDGEWSRPDSKEPVMVGEATQVHSSWESLKVFKQKTARSNLYLRDNEGVQGRTCVEGSRGRDTIGRETRLKERGHMGFKKAMVEGRKKRCQIAGLLWGTDPAGVRVPTLGEREEVGQNSGDQGLGDNMKGAEANVEGPEEGTYG